MVRLLNMLLREIMDATFPSVQGLVGWGSEQPYLVEDYLPMAGACNWMIFKVPTNPNNSKILWCESIAKIIKYIHLEA